MPRRVEFLRLAMVITEHQMHTTKASFENALLFPLNEGAGSTKFRLCSQITFQVHSEGLSEEGLCFMGVGPLFSWLLPAKNRICGKQFGPLPQSVKYRIPK